MAFHEIAVRTSNVTTGAANVELIGSIVIRSKLIEIGFTMVAATATTVGLGRPAAAGVTPTSPVTLVGEDNNDVPTTKTALAWGTSPTAPTVYMRRYGAAAIGAGQIWTFPRGIVLEKSGANNSLVLFNITGGSVMDVYFVVEE